MKVGSYFKIRVVDFNKNRWLPIYCKCFRDQLYASGSGPFLFKPSLHHITRSGGKNCFTARCVVCGTPNYYPRRTEFKI